LSPDIDSLLQSINLQSYNTKRHLNGTFRDPKYESDHPRIQCEHLTAPVQTLHPGRRVFYIAPARRAKFHS
jgi:hypothetical protein